MAIETELKLSLPAAALPRLRRHPLLAALRPVRQRLFNTYYDTADLALWRRRVALRHRRTGWGWLITVKSAEPASGGLARRNEWEAPSLPGAFDFSHIDDGALRDWLVERTPLLQPAFSTDFLRTVWLLEPAPGTRIEVALDRGEIVSGERREAICELELELVSGPEAALFELALALQADLPLRPACASKAERGYRLFRGTAPAAVRAGRSPLVSGMSPMAAFRAVARDCIAQLHGNEEGVRYGSDPEFVHQARVAIRRLRSALRLWRPLLPPAFVECWAAPWRELAQTLGEARNLDVFAVQTLPPLATAFPGHGGLARMGREIERRRERAAGAAQQALAAPAFARLLLAFPAAVEALAEDAAQPLLADFARTCLAHQRRRVRRRIAAGCGDAAAFHALRIEFKRLRYALEFFAPLFPGKALRRHTAASADLQELLGALNDAAVAGGIVAGLRVPAAADLVQGWLAGRHALIRELLPAALDGFASARAPWRGGKAS